MSWITILVIIIIGVPLALLVIWIIGMIGGAILGLVSKLWK